MSPSDVFRALADDNRRELLEMLSHGPLTSTQLGEPFSMSAPAISQHLRVLREAGLVAYEKVGKYRVYKLEPQPLLDAASWLRELEREWNQRLDRLEGVVERLSKGQDGGSHGRS